MDVKKKELKNGLAVVTEVMPHLRSVSIGVWVGCGSRFEHDGAVGISHFIEHLLFKGTKSRSAAEIAEIIDSVGGQLNAFTDKEYVGFYAKVLDEHMPLAFEVLSDLVLNPTFPATEMKKERNVIFEEINMVEDTPQELIHDIFMENFWRGHPLGRPISGSKESVANIRRKDVTEFFKTHYTASNTVISVAGNISHRAVHCLAERYFSTLSEGSQLDPGTPPNVNKSIEIREKPNLEQMHLCLGTISPSLESEDRFAIHLLSNILGGGVSSRLFQNIRERRGLVYSIDSSVQAYRDAGTLVVYAGTAGNTAAKVIDMVLREIRNLKEKLVLPNELKRAKENIKGSLMLSLESSSSRMSHLAQQQMYYGRFFPPGELIASIEKIRATELRRLANEVFDEKYLTLAALGSLNGANLDSLALKA